MRPLLLLALTPALLAAQRPSAPTLHVRSENDASLAPRLNVVREGASTQLPNTRTLDGPLGGDPRAVGNGAMVMGHDLVGPTR